ncbi:MAG: SLBB domain-containing protein [Oscillospiraceae bacterium]|nr:SLBB domain-containing protein [Oscillospiraceae bacterium]
MPFIFSGGLPEQKAASYNKPIEKLPPPPVAVLPVAGRPAVRAGDYVTAGQRIGEARHNIPVHTPVSGRVAAVEQRRRCTGEASLCVVVENDRKNALCPAVRAPLNPESLPPEETVTLLREAGLTGLDPLGVRGKAQAVLIDGCESEPYLTCRRRLLLERPGAVLGGARILARLFGVDRVHIACGDRDAAGLLQQKIRQDKAPAVADVPYTRRAGYSHDSCAVFGAADAAAMYDAVCLGKPLTHRVVTVSGSGVVEPKNLLCPVGTPIRFLLDACGGVQPKTFKILTGGPMTGHAQTDLDVPIEKNTPAVLAFCKDEERTAAHPACIRCGRCRVVCPEKLEPFLLLQYAEQPDILKDMGILRCTECGMCSYVCPGRLNLTQSFQTGKQRVKKGGGKT